VSLDLAYDDAQQAIAEALSHFCRDRCGDEVVKAGDGSLDQALWKSLAELGVLALATPEGDGGAVEMVAAMEPLGRAVFPGPLPASFFATQLLGEADRRSVASGAVIVSVGSPPLMPFAPMAQLFVALEDGRAFRATPSGAIDPVSTLGGETWGRVALERKEELPSRDRGDERLSLERAHALHDVAMASYLCAAGLRLVDDTAEHARTRKQFGKPIGEFQAVAHPLAECAIQLEGAATLARAAAQRFDDDHPQARASAAAARVAANRSSVHTARTSHQLFGAVGITLEGPVFHISRRIRQLASQAPTDASSRDALLGHFGL
jgi:alkylation response protein AidB-like acyl-CoA dehydrogenase